MTLADANAEDKGGSAGSHLGVDGEGLLGDRGKTGTGDDVPGIAESGEGKAWRILKTLKPEGVCGNASVAFDHAPGCYLVKSYGMDFAVSLPDKSITSQSAGSDVLLERLGGFLRLSLLWYLVKIKEIACTGRLVKLQQVKGGEAFSRGSHVLPLEKVALKYGANKAGFLERGGMLGGEEVKLADAAVRLHPLPRIPVVVTLWLGDAEFPARADILFDSTCELQLPTDVLWSIAMMTLLIL